MATVHTLNVVVPSISKAYAAPSAPSTSVSHPRTHQATARCSPSARRMRTTSGSPCTTRTRSLLSTSTSKKSASASPRCTAPTTKKRTTSASARRRSPRSCCAAIPKEWKSQDHYAVLGLSHLRYLATPEQIKLANRKKVLKHHPDKKAASGGKEETASKFLTGVNLNTNDRRVLQVHRQGARGAHEPRAQAPVRLGRPRVFGDGGRHPDCGGDQGPVTGLFTYTHVDADFFFRRASVSIFSPRSRLLLNSIPASQNAARPRARRPGRHQGRGRGVLRLLVQLRQLALVRVARQGGERGVGQVAPLSSSLRPCLCIASWFAFF